VFGLVRPGRGSSISCPVSHLFDLGEASLVVLVRKVRNKGFVGTGGNVIAEPFEFVEEEIFELSSPSRQVLIAFRYRFWIPSVPLDSINPLNTEDALDREMMRVSYIKGRHIRRFVLDVWARQQSAIR
jgi:hypothetical protein